MGRSLGLNPVVGRPSGSLRGGGRGRIGCPQEWRPLGTSHIPLTCDRGLGTPWGANLMPGAFWAGSLGCQRGSGSCDPPCLVFPVFPILTQGMWAGCMGWVLNSHLWGLRLQSCHSILCGGPFLRLPSSWGLTSPQSFSQRPSWGKCFLIFAIPLSKFWRHTNCRPSLCPPVLVCFVIVSTRFSLWSGCSLSRGLGWLCRRL